MGPDFTDLTFIVTGSIMVIVGCVLYFAMEIWPNLRGADTLFPTSVSLAISFGIAVATNGLVVGYGAGMSLMMVIALSVVMIVSFVWACLIMGKLHKLTYGKTKKT